MRLSIGTALTGLQTLSGSLAAIIENLLMESGSFILLEDGSFLLME